MTEGSKRTNQTLGIMNLDNANSRLLGLLICKVNRGSVTRLESVFGINLINR